MNLIPEILDIAIGFKIQLTLTPLSVCALMVLGVLVAVFWRWAKGRIR